MSANIEPHLRRQLFNGVTEDSVREYISELEREKAAIENAWFVLLHTANIERDYVQSLKKLIDDEIEYCHFFLDHCERARTEPDFNKWVFAPDVTVNNWTKEIEDQWTRTNGKIKVTIAIKKGQNSTRVTLRGANDNKHLKFYSSDYRREQIDYSNLRNQASIDAKIAEYKAKADDIFAAHEFPSYCQEKERFDNLRAMLRIITIPDPHPPKKQPEIVAVALATEAEGAAAPAQ